MAKIHVLQRVGYNLYQCVVHATTPAGNNAAGVAWATAIANSGRNQTSMVTGNGPGQIATAEANSVANGTVVEAQFIYQDDPSLNATDRQTALDTMANAAVASLLTSLQEELKFFGMTRA
jgi:hypothetical protein